MVKGFKTAPVLTLPGVGGVQCPVSHQQPLEAATLTNVPFPVDICLVTRPSHSQPLLTVTLSFIPATTAIKMAAGDPRCISLTL